MKDLETLLNSTNLEDIILAIRIAEKGELEQYFRTITTDTKIRNHKLNLSGVYLFWLITDNYKVFIGSVAILISNTGSSRYDLDFRTEI